MALSVTSAIWQQINSPALDIRRFISSLVSSEGVAASGDMAVAQRAAGANMSVDIAAGEALVEGDAVTNQGLYYAYNDGVVNLTGFTAAHATNPRIDRVCLRLRDAFHGDAANDIAFVIVTGTATSGATLANLSGAAAVPASHLLLANILIPATSTTITTANIGNVASVLSPSGSLPAGSLVPYAGAAAPTGYLLCDGSAVSRTTYLALFNAISTAYGTGDGSTTFNVPDMRGRAPWGKGTHTDVDVLGDSDGLAVGSRRPAASVTNTTADAGGATGGAGAQMALLQGYLTVNFIIKT